MVNLYDSPAQAQFINTYVPIQFDGLYRMADKAQKDMDKGTELLDKLAESKSLGSLSDVDNATWEKEVANPIQAVVNENVKSNYDLTNPTVLGKLSSMTRNIANGPVARKLLNSRETLKQAASKVDPQWGNTYSDIFRNYDTTKSGEYTGTPMDYVGWEKTGDQFTSEITPRYVGTKGGYRIMKIDPNDINQVVNEKSNEISSNPQVNMLIDKDVNEGRIDPNKYTITDPTTKQKVVDPNWRTRYAKDMIAKTKMDATKGAKYEYDQFAADSNKVAELRMYHAQTLALKHQAIEKNNVVENYIRDKQVEVYANKANQMLNKVGSQLSKYTNPSVRFNVAASIFGPGAASYLVSAMKNDELSQKMNTLTALKSDLQAQNKPTDDINNQISEINRQLNSNSLDIKNHRGDFTIAMNNEENKAMSGRSTIFSKPQMISLNRVETPSVIGSTYGEIAFGSKTKVMNSSGVTMNGLVGPSSKLLLRNSYGSSSKEDALKEMTGRIHNPVDRKLYTPVLNRFVNDMSSGKYDNKGFVMPGNSSLITKDGSSLESVYYVPEDALTKDEAKALRSLYGREEFLTKDTEYDADNAIQKSVKKKYIPIPTYMGSVNTDNFTANTITNAKIVHDAGTKDYFIQKGQNGSTSRTVDSTSDEE